MSGIVAIVGRPNVGKSTLFNRLVEARQAIVDDESGVTRDRHYGTAEWTGVEFNVIDTGGYVVGSEDVFERAIREQVHIAMEEADVLIFMVDVTQGVTYADEEFASLIRQSPKKVILAANKVDSGNRQNLAFEFYALGIAEVVPISAMSGSGTGELLDLVVANLPAGPVVDPAEGKPRYAIVGRPNVGKSSFVNALLDRDEHIVTPIAGTTRDSLDTHFQAFGYDVVLVDTAGLRKRSKVRENVEFYSTIRAMRAIEECDVAILLLDASSGLEQQDMHIVQQIIKSQRGLVIAVNKWDLIEDKTPGGVRAFELAIRKRLEPFSDVPILFVSVKERQRLLKVLDAAAKVYENKRKKVSTHELNEVMLAAIAAHHPPAMGGRLVRIKYVTQVTPSQIPTFLFFANHPKHVQESYQRYLENRLREHFDFTGVPMNVFFRKK